MKVLLVQPPTLRSFGLQTFMLPEPLGLELVAASLMPEHEVHLLDMRLEPGLANELASFQPDAVGVSTCFTSDAYNVYRILQVVREQNPRIFTFVGGQHATMAHADFFGKADAVVLGEGESTAHELLRRWEQNKPLNQVGGIVFRCGDSWIPSQPRSLIDNLDETPLPARSLISKYLPHYFIGARQPCSSVETSRGCPYRCKFCSVWRFFRHSFRSRSPLRVVQELEQIESPHVFFTDDNALANPLRSDTIISEIEKAGVHKHYLMQIRADSVSSHRDLLVKWRNIGLEAVFIGFESINQQRLNEFAKSLSVNSIEEAVETLRSLNITVMSSFIINPDFDKKDFAALRRFVRHMRLPMPTFSILTPLPGTVLYEEKAKEITDHNYELYDLLHSTLPTRLGLKGFYRQFIRLYISSYLPYFTPSGLFKTFTTRNVGSFFNVTFKGLRMLAANNYRALTRHHQLPPGKLSEANFPKQAWHLEHGKV
jgi:radical SAM superfamily enzyme YgiQ (UPF0313 family)